MTTGKADEALDVPADCLRRDPAELLRQFEKWSEENEWLKAEKASTGRRVSLARKHRRLREAFAAFLASVAAALVALVQRSTPGPGPIAQQLRDRWRDTQSPPPRLVVVNTLVAAPGAPSI